LLATTISLNKRAIILAPWVLIEGAGEFRAKNP